jgi:Uncharacterised nucleotidyltransferase
VTQVEERDARALSRHAFVAALRPGGGDLAHVVERHGARIDWRWIVERAAAHKVAALLAARMDACGVTPQLADDLRAQLRAIPDAAAASAGAAQQTLHELAELYERAAIPFLVIKGSVLAERVYGDPHLRPFEDVDVVVRPEDVGRAEQVLRSLGYRLGRIRRLLATAPHGEAEAQLAEAVTRRFYERFHHEIPFVPARGDQRLPVDLHWRVAPAVVLNIGTEELWARTASVPVAGVRITTLDAEATLLHLAVHATTCSLAGFKLLPLCDVAWVVTQCGGYRDLWELAAAWRVRAHLETVLDTVERGLGVSIPASVRAARPRRHEAGAAVRRVARDAFLIDYRGNTEVPRLQRAWAEILWNVAMGCLRYNVARSLRVRLSRLRWRLLRWRARVRSAA